MHYRIKFLNFIKFALQNAWIINAFDEPRGVQVKSLVSSNLGCYRKTHSYLDARLSVGVGLPNPYERAVCDIIVKYPQIFGFYYKD